LRAGRGAGRAGACGRGPGHRRRHAAAAASASAASNGGGGGGGGGGGRLGCRHHSCNLCAPPPSERQPLGRGAASLARRPLARAEAARWRGSGSSGASRRQRRQRRRRSALERPDLGLGSSSGSIIIRPIIIPRPSISSPASARGPPDPRRLARARRRGIVVGLIVAIALFFSSGGGSGGGGSSSSSPNGGRRATIISP
jgi:hypothetical protein